jgi:mRNA interferase HicA
MNRATLLRHLRRHGCYLKREGRAHLLWSNPATGAVEAVTRHSDIPEGLARKIWSGLGIDEVGRTQGG